MEDKLDTSAMAQYHGGSFEEFIIHTSSMPDLKDVLPFNHVPIFLVELYNPGMSWTIVDVLEELA